ncbi:MAG: ribosome assembly RNA-binding protein YhbY [Clostridiales bacterium]|nr:ribosome assembly RNA-binding protein YhbY [Clostridiales bacterium]
MITGKQRSYLKGLANSIEPIIQIGKSGLTQNIITQIDEALEARELIKIKLLDTSLLDAKETANEICAELNAEYVQSIGSKFVLYRQSKKNKTIQLP